MELFKNKRGKIEMKLDTSEDRVAAYMMNKIDESALQKPDHELMARWSQILTLWLNHHSPVQAANAHMNLCEQQGNKISLRTAWNDLKHATSIWGNIGEVSYQATLRLLYEFSMRVFKLAMKTRDLKEMNRAITEMREISRELHLLNAFDDDGDREATKFVLEIRLSDDQQLTYDLDNYEILPNEISKRVLDAVNNAEVNEEAFLNIVESSKIHKG